MAAPTWTYSDWILSSTYPIGSIARLQRLELHIQEISDRISTGNYSNPKGSHDKNPLTDLLAARQKDYEREKNLTASLSGRGSSFTRARVLPQ